MCCTLLCTRCHTWFSTIIHCMWTYNLNLSVLWKWHYMFTLQSDTNTFQHLNCIILYSTYHCGFVSFQLLCYSGEVLFIHSLWQLSFQLVSGNHFTVLPAVKHVSCFHQCSVAGLWDWACDLLYGWVILNLAEENEGSGWGERKIE